MTAFEKDFKRMTYKQLSEKYEMSKTLIWRKAKSLGLKKIKCNQKPSWTEQQENLLILMYQDNQKWLDISVATGKSKEACRAKIKNLGINRKNG